MDQQAWWPPGTHQCRCFPGDDCWPSPPIWSSFNQTLNGRLIAIVPIASPCHNSSFGPYDATACDQLRSVWDYTSTHIETSSSPMAFFFANMSCDPFTAPEDQCVVGAYVQYAVNATTAEHYRLTMKFAQEHNIRLVVRNTGHDYLGKSTGAGALALWTHHLRDIEILESYESPFYNGTAMRVGAGVLSWEAQEAAHEHGLVVVGGNGRTFGLAADQVLEWEVVTALGEQIMATTEQNEDLYWALSGGGGGTYAAVLSLTVRAYPDFRTAAANLTFTSEGVSSDAFYYAVQTFLLGLPGITEAGAVCIWLLAPGVFQVQPTTAPGMTSDELQVFFQPTLDALKDKGIAHDYHIAEFPTYTDSFYAMNPAPNVTKLNAGGRLLPRSLLESKDSIASLVDVLAFLVDQNAVVSGVSIDVSRAPAAPNAVHSAWREAIVSAAIGTPYNLTSLEANIAGQRLISDVLDPKLDSLMPESPAAYLNEANFREPDFQRLFYGDNYQRLLEVKHKYDPLGVFWGTTAVGSEGWAIKEDERLCRM
ncbi:FAD binding domain-containing protein [Pseudomassariella vexata]|uniref:FAD binding domain-containing protein n=1 Tax=Pseudomassariella vexata TaxID=1141098 RepID=A0A1Y2E7R9_9PEZI|nr:FAD binding domain-containing protein [Pseudomassariella vexata]ORY67580.1 FAD binding domain-containing protein [Pseudomassariella vexata]